MPIVKNVRTAVTDALTPLLPKTWKLVPHTTNFGVISQPVVVLKLEEVKRHPDAPNGARLISYTLTIIEPKTEPGPADDALDTKLLLLLAAIDKAPGIAWSTAKRVVTDTNPAFDVTLTFDSINKPEGV